MWPTGWCWGPCTFKPTGNCVTGVTGTKTVFPPKSLLLNWCAFRGWSEMICGCCTVRLSKSMATRDECYCFFIIHCHAIKSFSDVDCCCQRIWFAIWTFWIHIDKSHLYCGKRIFKLPFTPVPRISEPLTLRTPVDIFRRFPCVFTTTGEPKGWKSHWFKCNVCSKNHQISPRDFLPVLLLYGPQQSTSFIKICIVWPTIEWGKPLCAVSSTATSICRSIGSGAMPSHAYEQWSIMTIVSRPPFLGSCHSGLQIIFDCLEIKTFKCFCIVELVADWWRCSSMCFQYS